VVAMLGIAKDASPIAALSRLETHDLRTMTVDRKQV
jgi:hypothetical protein